MKKSISMVLIVFVLALFPACFSSIDTFAQENPEIFIQTGCLGSIYKTCLSPDEKSILTISSLSVPYDTDSPLDGIMKLWDVESGREIRTFEGRHYKPVNSVCFSPDRKYILSCSDDKTIKLWDVNSGKEIRSYKGIHDSVVRVVAFTPDAKYALSGGEDKCVKKWDIKTEKVAGTIVMSDVSIMKIILTPVLIVCFLM